MAWLLYRACLYLLYVSTGLKPIGPYPKVVGDFRRVVGDILGDILQIIARLNFIRDSRLLYFNYGHTHQEAPDPV